MGYCGHTWLLSTCVKNFSSLPSHLTMGLPLLSIASYVLYYSCIVYSKVSYSPPFPKPALTHVLQDQPKCP